MLAFSFADKGTCEADHDPLFTTICPGALRAAGASA